MNTKKLFKTLKLVLVIPLLLIVVNHGYLLSMDNSDGQAFIWKVETGNNKVYLLGSIHLLKQENYPLHEKIENAFNDAQKIVFEVNMDSIKSPKVQQLVLGKAKYSNDKTLKSTIGDSIFQLTSQKTEPLGINLEQLNGFKPWFVSISIVAVKLQHLGFDPKFGVDLHFVTKAKAENKQTFGLETFEDQFNLFDSFSDEIQVEFLLQTLAELETLEEEFNLILKAWSEGDVLNLEKHLLSTFLDYPALYEKLLVERNKKWMISIEKFLKDDVNYLIIVGAAHLIGEEGLIKLLQKKGCNVEQL